MWIPVCKMCYSHCLVISHVSMNFCDAHFRGATCLWNITWPLCISSWQAWKTSLHTAVMKVSQIAYNIGGCVNYRTGSSRDWSQSYTLQFTTKTEIAHCVLISQEISASNSVARDHELCGNNYQWCDNWLWYKIFQYLFKSSKPKYCVYLQCALMSVLYIWRDCSFVIIAGLPEFHWSLSVKSIT